MSLRYTPEAILASFPDTPVLVSSPEKTPKSKQPKSVKPSVVADTADHYPHHRDNLPAILNYIEKMPEAIDGDRGSTVTFNDVLKLISTFGLSVEETLALLWKHWNHRCKPEWTLDELRKKVQDAAAFYEKMSRNRPFVAGFRWKDNGFHKTVFRGKGDSADVAYAWVSAPYTELH